MDIIGRSPTPRYPYRCEKNISLPSGRSCASRAVYLFVFCAASNRVCVSPHVPFLTGRVAERDKSSPKRSRSLPPPAPFSPSSLDCLACSFSAHAASFPPMAARCCVQFAALFWSRTCFENVARIRRRIKFRSGGGAHFENSRCT